MIAQAQHRHTGRVIIAAVLALASAAGPAAEVPQRGAAAQVRASARVLAGVRVEQGKRLPQAGQHVQITRVASGDTLIEFL